jgi:hypothetical protein
MGQHAKYVHWFEETSVIYPHYFQLAPTMTITQLGSSN